LPEPLVIAERFKFDKRDQKQGESIADYLVALKQLSARCKFETFLESALRDQFVCGSKRASNQEGLKVLVRSAFHGT
jgi:hypothetical protein